MLRTGKDRNAELSKANVDAFRRLHQRLYSNGNNILAVVGAGVSIRAGYPSWSSLLTMMAERVVSLSPQFSETIAKLGYSQDVLWRAEEYRRFLTEDRYLDLLREVFGPPVPCSPIDDCIQNLVGLKFKHMLTTNYDKVLEEAHFRKMQMVPNVIDWTNHSDVNEFMYRASDPGYDRRYVYLHGRYNDPQRIILSDRDYTDRYLRGNDTVLRLSALFSTYTLVFVGFSLSDPALTHLLRQVRIAQGPGAPRHFALLALNSAKEDEMLERNRLSSKFGVEPIFYSLDNSHEGLCVMVNQLSNPPSDSPPNLPFTRPKGPDNPDDPQKGNWGGAFRKDGYELKASIENLKGRSSMHSFESSPHDTLYEVKLWVESESYMEIQEGAVARFHLHPTFIPDVRDIPFKDRTATLVLVAYGAFTVGVEILGTTVELELDLASDEVSAPIRFKQN